MTFFEDRQTDRPNDSAERAGESGSGDQMKFGKRRQVVAIRLAIEVFTLCAVVFVLRSPLEAQPVSRIGFLSRDVHPADSRASLNRSRFEAFRKGMSELGYAEGKNLLIEARYADGRLERLPALAEELVRSRVDVIVADTAASARAAKKASSTSPIVMVSAGRECYRADEHYL
jgi:ABC-type uncharacterized transport system substrate-binding protein